MLKYQLQYLFEAEYKDGTIYRQNPQDHSVKFPPIQDEHGEWQGKSCFTDVTEDAQNHKIKKFSIIGKGNTITVNLENGLFEINGLPVLLEEEKLPMLPEHFELIYYRQVSVSQNITYGDVTVLEDGGIFVEYFIGWKCNIGGREYKQKLAVA